MKPWHRLASGLTLPSSGRHKGRFGPLRRRSCQTLGRIEHAMRTAQAFLALFLAVAQLAPSDAFAAEKWFLLARHGECFSVRSLERKFSDIGTVAEPEAFIRFALAKGAKVTSKAVPVQVGSAVEVLVPEKELSLVFVTAESCSKVETK
jgi:hypothetical protein